MENRRHGIIRAGTARYRVPSLILAVVKHTPNRQLLLSWWLTVAYTAHAQGPKCHENTKLLYFK